MPDQIQPKPENLSRVEKLIDAIMEVDLNKDVVLGYVKDKGMRDKVSVDRELWEKVVMVMEEFRE